MALLGSIEREVRDRSLAARITLLLIAVAIVVCDSAMLVRAPQDRPQARALVRVQHAAPPADVLPIVEAAAPRPQPQAGPRRAALLVGVDNAPGAPPLPGSRADARTMRDALLMYGFDPGGIVMLLDGDATRARVLGAIDQLAARSTDESISVVSFSAHSFISGQGATMRVWDGRISAVEIARRLGRVRGRVWTTFATCYAGGYAVPGAVGPNRIAVFSSSATNKSLQLGSAGSFTVLYIARYAMLNGEADTSVEAAFRYAYEHIALANRPSVPTMDDRIDGELVLGDPPKRPAVAEPPAKAEHVSRPQNVEPSPEPSLARRIAKVPELALRLGSGAVRAHATHPAQSTRLDAVSGAETEPAHLLTSSGVIEVL